MNDVRNVPQVSTGTKSTIGGTRMSEAATPAVAAGNRVSTTLLLAQAEALFQRFHQLLTSDPAKAGQDAAPELGKLAAFSGVCEFPVRVKCASLPWHTFRAALRGEEEAKTE